VLILLSSKHLFETRSGFQRLEETAAEFSKHWHFLQAASRMKRGQQKVTESCEVGFHGLISKLLTGITASSFAMWLLWV
jgi:hypothetical protein